MPRLARPLAWYPSLLDGDKGGSWGRSAPGMWTCVADLDWPPGFSTKFCDSGEFCTTKHPHRMLLREAIAAGLSVVRDRYRKAGRSATRRVGWSSDAGSFWTRWWCSWGLLLGLLLGWSLGAALAFT